MMTLTGAALIFGFLLLAATTQAKTMEMPVSKGEQSRWLRWVIPLPKRIRIEKKVQVKASEVCIRLREGAGDVEQNAAEELVALFKEKAGITPSSGPASFEVLIGVCEPQGRISGTIVPGAADLATAPNSEQACVIRPLKGNRLALTSLDERGVYYAVQTFRHLIEAQFADGKVTIPLAEVTDWPDLAERGEWGGWTAGDFGKWFGPEKMNLIEVHASLSIDKDGKGVAAIGQDLLDKGRLHAVKVVPIIMHLDYLQDTGIADRFPELKGVGKSAQPRTDTQTLCFSKPKMTEVLADWFSCLGAQKGVTDINVWLSEYEGQCGCVECERAERAGVPQHALETQAVGRALEIARRKYPHLRARVLLTQGTFPVNDRVLAAAEQVGVQVSYYCGGGRPLSTYDSSREPMIYPLMAEYAKRHWLSVYPQFTASYGTVCPWSGPQFIRFRMTEYVEKGLESVCGYTVPENRLHDFNVTAAAEWSWNAHGRTEREFAAAWATRRGLKDPDRVAEWAALLGPVGWDVYGSGYAASPFTNSLTSAARLVANAAKPELGGGLWRYFPTVEHIDRDLAECEKALAIIEELDAPALLAETRVIHAYVQMVKESFTIANLVADADLSADGERRKLQAAMCRLATAGAQNVASLKEWEKALGPPITAPRYYGTLLATETTVEEIGKGLSAFGIQDPAKPYRRHRIGSWQSDRPEKEGWIQKQWEVTEYVFGAGRYQVEFQYTHGANGLPTRRVALLSAAKDHPDQLAELAVDEHSGFAGHESEANTYVVNLTNYDAVVRYFVAADILAVPSTNGQVWMKRDEAAPLSFPVPALQPLTAEQRARLPHRGGPFFEKGGLRVGVVLGGYGSVSLLQGLGKVSGADVQPVPRLSSKAVRKCQVLVLPQPRDPGTLEEKQAELLRAFVQQGGGLIVTHSAVGYRGFPPIVREVCAKGALHVRDPEWIVVLEHPVTHGLPKDQPLPHSYYDHIELEPGPKGVVLAKAKLSGRPVVVCGDFGKGRYVACGLALGLSPEDNDVAPTEAERTLLENAVRWAGRLAFTLGARGR